MTANGDENTGIYGAAPAKERSTASEQGAQGETPAAQKSAQTRIPFPNLADEVLNVLDADKKIYTSRRERAALRAALGTATMICDIQARRLAAANTHRGRLTHVGEFVVLEAKRCADAIWAARERIDIPDKDPECGGSQPAASAPRSRS